MHRGPAGPTLKILPVGAGRWTERVQQPEPCGSVWWRSTAGVVLNYAHEGKEGCEREETTCDDKSGKAREIIEGANYDLATFGQRAK